MASLSTRDEIKNARLAQLRAEELNARLLSIFAEYGARLPYEALVAIEAATRARRPGAPMTAAEALELKYTGQVQ